MLFNSNDSMKKMFTSIDIGSDTIKFIVAEKLNNKLNVLASHVVKSKGVRKGLIIDSNLAVNAIKDGIKEVNKKLGIEIKKVIVNVPNYNAKFMLVTGSININNENNIITTEDINRVIKDSVYSKIEHDYELVTVIPIDYMIDDNGGIEKPVGMTGKKLSIKGIMISTPKKNIYSVLSVLEAVGLDVVDITFTGIGDYYEVRNDNLDKKVGVIINLGHETTTVSVINRSKFVNTETLQIGGQNIEKDISYVFGISIFDARILKEKFASSHKRFSQLTDIYEVKNTVGETLKLNQLEVTEVVMSRLSEILNYAKKQILLLTKQNINYVIITGGLTEIKSFKNLAFEILGKDVIIFDEDTIGVRDNKFITSLGMIRYFIDKMDKRGKNYSMIEEIDSNKLEMPDNKNKKNKAVVSKIFSNFIGNKEEK